MIVFAYPGARPSNPESFARNSQLAEAFAGIGKVHFRPNVPKFGWSRFAEREIQAIDEEEKKVDAEFVLVGFSLGARFVHWFAQHTYPNAIWCHSGNFIRSELRFRLDSRTNVILSYNDEETNKLPSWGRWYSMEEYAQQAQQHYRTQGIEPTMLVGKSNVDRFGKRHHWAPELNDQVVTLIKGKTC